MFKKVLIANRGEIAVRVIRACKEMGIATVAVVSSADRDALHSYLADETVCIGPPAAQESYLNIQQILSAALLRGVDAIHPGFGFLSENAEFAESCRRCGLEFIGPTADAIRMLGDKSAAKATALSCGVPTIPGSDGAPQSYEDLLDCANRVGYPLLIKAAAGGGGRGIRRVDEADALKNAYDAARKEAETCFGDPSVYVEKLLEHTRHIEFQIIADRYGHVVHLGERDCSLQRRRQKILEEAPSTALTPALRERMGADAVKCARAVGYENTGTVEYLLDAQGNYYFMEMNTRIQVEHPVTEMITQLDLVKEQLRVAAGEPLSFTQEEVWIRGHAIECRVNAEDPGKNFAPCGGTVDILHVPGGNGVRFDSAVYQGYQMPIHYDSMLGKLITWGHTREEAAARMKSALSEIIVDGVTNNISFVRQILSAPDFVSGRYDTDTVSRILEENR